jgi:hypothetical protein
MLILAQIALCPLLAIDNTEYKAPPKRRLPMFDYLEAIRHTVELLYNDVCANHVQNL